MFQSLSLSESQQIGKHTKKMEDHGSSGTQSRAIWQKGKNNGAQYQTTRRYTDSVFTAVKSSYQETELFLAKLISPHQLSYRHFQTDSPLCTSVTFDADSQGQGRLQS
jgi:hypothetical protein